MEVKLSKVISDANAVKACSPDLRKRADGFATKPRMISTSTSNAPLSAAAASEVDV
jgi:hypothetical protein